MNHMKPKPHFLKRAAALLMSALMLASAAPPAALATDAGQGQPEPQAADPKSYSFATPEDAYSEDAGKTLLTVTRDDAAGAETVEVTAYDLSAAYGDDYVLLQDGEPVERLPDGRSLFDAFREDGQLAGIEETDLAILAGALEMQETGSTPEELAGIEEEDCSGSPVEILDRAGARVAVAEVRFAAGQSSAALELEFLDDDVPEYSETFMLGIVGGGSVSVSIRDNDAPAPSATVAFACTQAAEDNSGTADVYLTRTGDLATLSSVLVSRDGAPYGYVSFNPWQDTQLVCLPRGEYSLSEPSGCVADGATVTVDANQVATAIQDVSGAQALMNADDVRGYVAPADPELDAIPAYSVLPAQISGAAGLARASAYAPNSKVKVKTEANKSWMKEWAWGENVTGSIGNHPTYEDEECFVVTDTIVNEWTTDASGNLKSRDSYSGNLFSKDNNRSDGDGQKFGVGDKKNEIQTDTSAKYDSFHKSTMSVISASFDVYGMESATLNFADGGSGTAKIKVGYEYNGQTSLYEVGDFHESDKMKAQEGTTYLFPSLLDGEGVKSAKGPIKLIFQNIDPSNKSVGNKVYLANAVKFNKREYQIHLVGSEPLAYSGSNQSVTFDASSNNFIMTPWMDPSTDKGGKSHIPLVYHTEGNYQMEVDSYRVVSHADPNSHSNWVPISRDSNKTPYVSFDKDFIKNFEDKYAYGTKRTDGKEICGFDIELKMRKVSVDYTLVDSNLGSLEIENLPADGNLYKGDTAVFTGKAAGGSGSFNGVFIRARSASNYEWTTLTRYADSDGKVRVPIDKDHDVYEFEGVYSAGADTLTVQFKDGAEGRGQLIGAQGEGIVVGKDEYVKNSFVPLMAKPKDGYVTQWTNQNGNRFYGDIFYYQLDGNPDHNTFTLDFIKPANMVTADVSGVLTVTDYNMKNPQRSTSHALANAECAVTASTGREYTCRTDEQGYYEIKGFQGVSSGVYSMHITSGGLSTYLYFTLGDSKSYRQELSPFMPGSFFPDKVEVHVSSTGEDNDQVQLREQDLATVTVKVCNPSEDVYSLDSVMLNFVLTEDYGGSAGAAVYTEEAAFDEELTKREGGGLYTYYTATLNSMDIPEHTALYVEVIGFTEVNGTQIQISSGMVNSGYTFLAELNDISIPVKEYPPAVPGAVSGESVDLDNLDVPFIGLLDFSVGTRDGAFFVRTPDKNNPQMYTLTAGYSIHPAFGKSNLTDRTEEAKKDLNALYGAKDSGGKAVGDTSGVSGNIMVDGSDMKSGAGTDKTSNMEQSLKKTKIYIEPAVYMQLTFKANDDGPSDLVAYDMVVGADVRVKGNYPFDIEGVPMFVNVEFSGEAYIEGQGSFPQDSPNSISSESDSIGSVMYDNSRTEDLWDVFINIPLFKTKMKGGVGLNNLASLYLDGSVTIALGMEVMPKVDAGGSIAASIGVGTDILMFSPELSIAPSAIEFGSQRILDNLKQIGDMPRSASERAGSLEDAEQSLSQQFSNGLDGAVLKPAARSASYETAGAVSSDVLLDNAVKGGKVTLTRLDNGTLMATMLADNGAREDSYNFLSGVYSLSSDNGETWSKPQAVSGSKALQFDVNVFTLNSALLVTWSEGDLDEALEGCDRDNLKAPEAAKALNAMDLKGRYFDKETGEPMGEPFTIGGSPDVAFSMLNAYESGGKVYCYYNRAQYAVKDSVTLSDLLNREITIACAVLEGSEVKDTTRVEAQNPDAPNQTYRITEIAPFEYQGLRGEAIVIDQDGQLVLKDSAGNITSPSNLDRQVFLRFYTMKDGEFVSSRLFPVSDPNLCAQNVQVAQNGGHIALLWSQNGEIVYLSDFLSLDGDEYACYQADLETGTITTHEHESEQDYETVAVPYHTDIQSAAAHTTLDAGRTFTASMSADGDVLVNWVGDNQDNLSSDEVYGVMLQAGTLEGESDESGEGRAVQVLSPVGKPVALTSESAPLGRMDSLCLAENSFLIAYAKLDGETRVESKGAQIKAVHSTYEPDLAITGLDVDRYPMPGTDMKVEVTVENQGLKTLDGVKLTASGVGEDAAFTSDTPVLPGDTQSFTLTVAVPEDFNRSADLTVTASGLNGQSGYTASESEQVLYEPYFVPEEMSTLTSVPDTWNYTAATTVKNIGNAPGVPGFTYMSYVPGTTDEELHVQHEFKAKAELAPGGISTYTHLLEDTPAENGSIRVHLSLGDGFDQTQEGYAPEPVTTDDGPDDNPTEFPFTDVPDSAWYAPAVKAAYAAGYMTGVSATLFNPNGITTRATVAQVLYNMEGKPQLRARIRFSDVPEGAWYADAVNWAAQNGIINGYGNGKFGPNDLATREQVAAMLGRYANWKGLPEKDSSVTLDDFKDPSAVSSWAREPMLWAVKQGVIKGKGGRLAPKDTTTRAELAQMLVNLLG